MACRTHTAVPDSPRQPKRKSTETGCRQIQHELTGYRIADNGSRTLGAQRFQGLFHSLSKVLFIFRSHYLFAIGLGAIFSLRRNTPPFAQHYQTARLLDPSRYGLDADRRNGTFALHGVTFQSALPTCPALVITLALQFHSFRFLPLRIQA